MLGAVNIMYLTLNSLQGLNMTLDYSVMMKMAAYSKTNGKNTGYTRDLHDDL